MADPTPGHLLTQLGASLPHPYRVVRDGPVVRGAADMAFRLLTEVPVEVPISWLVPADSPRFGQPDAQHEIALAQIDEHLPPILVRRSSMRVIDGMHRLGAAARRGDRTIRVCFFDGSEDDAFVLAVSSNTRHGLPLTMAERRAAAERILRARPEMSNRSVARIAGLAAKTVAAIRRTSGVDVPQSSARVGCDGRWRPLHPAERRRIAGQLLVEQPDASLRNIARHAGISPGTARDVRERVRRGEDPTAPRQRARDKRPGAAVSLRRPSAPVDQSSMLRALQRDPSLLYSNEGRSVLRWLSIRAVGHADCEKIVPKIPPHCATVVARMARGSAVAWADFADALERRAQEPASLPAGRAPTTS